MSLNLDPNTGISKWELRNWMTALTNGYPISDEIRKAMVGKAVKVMAHSDNERTTARIIDVLCKMDSLNVKREALEAAAQLKATEQHNHLHIHGAVGDPALEHRMEQLGLTQPSRLEQMLQERLPDPPANGHTNGYHNGTNGHTTNGHNGHHHDG